MHLSDRAKRLLVAALAAVAAFLTVFALDNAVEDPGPDPEPTVTTATTEPTTTTSSTTTTTAPTTTTTQPPPPAGRPSIFTTGPTPEEGLTGVHGSQVMALCAANGGVLEDVYITGQVEVTQAGCTVRNFRQNVNGQSYGWRQCGTLMSPCSAPAGSNANALVLEDGRIYNMSSAAFWGGNATLRRLEVHESQGDAFKPLSNVTISGSWGHHIGHAVDSHADFVQFQGGTHANVHVVGNYCDLDVRLGYIADGSYNSQACVQTNSNHTVTGSTVAGNWFAGGNFTVRCDSEPGLAITGNVFTRDSYRNGIRTGCPTWSGNTWEDGAAA